MQNDTGIPRITMEIRKAHDLRAIFPLPDRNMHMSTENVSGFEYLHKPLQMLGANYIPMRGPFLSLASFMMLGHS